MATVLKIKRSSTANAPATLGQGEVAYSWGSGATNGQRLYIGTGTETGGNAANIEVIGGKYYTDRIKFGGTDFANSLLIGHSTTGTLSNAHSNTGVGVYALDALTSAAQNTAVGLSAGSAITSGASNTALGSGALTTSSTANHNTAIGRQSLKLTTGTGNTALGRDAGEIIAAGSYNICIGKDAGDNITSGDSNVIIGSIDAGSATGDKQLIIADGEDGSVAWIKGDSSANVTVGGNIHATNIKTEGTNFTGSLLVGHSTTGTLNTATSNTGVGIAALDALTSGDNNTAVGYAAGSAAAATAGNTLIGANAGILTLGNNNTVVGKDAYNASNSSASYWNQAFGVDALGAAGASVAAIGNSAFGKDAGASVTSGDYNLLLGTDAGQNITTGSGNVIIGTDDAASASGDRQLMISGYDGSTTTTWIDGDSSGNLTFSGKLQSVTDPTSAQDAATKAYVDTAITAENLDFQGDSGGALEIDLDSETLTIAGGTGIDTVGATNTLTVAIDSTVMTGKTEGTNFTGSLLVGHSTTGTLDAAQYNTGVGLTALDAITSGDNNTAVGYGALTANLSGQRNVALGVNALVTNSSGQQNVAIGHGAVDNANSSYNVGIGTDALTDATGSRNTALGHRAGFAVAGGEYNINIGYTAGDNITSGSGNVVIGKADVASATADDQLSISDGEDGSVVWLTGDSSANVTVGGNIHATNIKTEGTNFTGSLLVGHATTGTLSSADRNTAVGINAMDAITTGDQNTIIGYDAGTALTTAPNNTFVGRAAGKSVTTGAGTGGSTYVGDAAGFNHTGANNTAVGKSSMQGTGSATGYENSAFGQQALVALSSGLRNTGIGNYSGGAINTGSYNIALGYNSGDNITTGSGNVVIGKANVSSATGDDQLSISDGEDGSVVWLTGDSSGNLTFNGKLKNVTDPTAAQDVATKSYVDAVATGLDVKDSVTLATTAALATSTYANGAGTITANANGALSVDGVAVAVDDRILVKNQASALQNGIYKVTATGSAGAVFVLTRTPDADTASEITGGAFTFVEKGTVNADNGYVFTHDGTPTLGSTSITVAQFSGAGQITAGAALLKTNNTLDVRVDDSSIQVTSDALNVKALGVTNAMLAGSIANAKLANSVITVTDGTNSTATALGGTVTFTESEAIDITESSGTVTIAAEVATSANKGVASFNTGNFTVASGDVTVTTIDGGSY